MPFRVSRHGTEDLTYHETLAPHFKRPTRGVRAENDDWWEEVRAFALVLPVATAFSHTTAAVIQSLPLPLDSETPLHVTTDVSHHRGRREGLVWHRRPLQQIERWHALPVTAPLRTWHDLASMLSHDDLVVVADVLLRRRLCTKELIQDVRGVRHFRKLAKAAAVADGGSASPEESRLRLEILDRGLPPPLLNHHVIEHGIWVGCGDFAWPEFRVVADYDGKHHERARQRHQDALTRDDYADAGWRHVPITSEMRREHAVDRIERALRKRGWSGPWVL